RFARRARRSSRKNRSMAWPSSTTGRDGRPQGVQPTHPRLEHYSCTYGQLPPEGVFATYVPADSLDLPTGEASWHSDCKTILIPAAGGDGRFGVAASVPLAGSAAADKRDACRHGPDPSTARGY